MMNPILSSSVRRRMRGVRTPVIIALYDLLIAVFALLILKGISAETLPMKRMRSGIDYYIMMLGVQFLLTILIAPAMTSGSISGERERQTLDLLLVTNTGAFRIVWGKFLESFAFAALLIFSTLPMLCIVLIPGGVTMLQILTSMLFMLVTAFGALSIGTLCSALFRRTVASTVAAYLIVFAIGAGTLLVAGLQLNDVAARFNYDTTEFATMTSQQLMALVPKALFINPGMGYLCLVADQTLLMHGTFSMLGNGYWLYYILEALRFDVLVWINMGTVAALGTLFVSASALTLRSGRRVRVRK